MELEPHFESYVPAQYDTRVKDETASVTDVSILLLSSLFYIFSIQTLNNVLPVPGGSY